MNLRFPWGTTPTLRRIIKGQRELIQSMEQEIKLKDAERGKPAICVYPLVGDRVQIATFESGRPTNQAVTMNTGDKVQLTYTVPYTKQRRIIKIETLDHWED